MAEATKQAISKDNERQAKILKAIGERARAVQEHALKSHIALAAAAKAVIASGAHDAQGADGPLGTGTQSAFLDHMEAGFDAPDFGLNSCQQFLEQASADLKAHDIKGAEAQIRDYFSCILKPKHIQPF
jgi:hypothetical protein